MSEPGSTPADFAVKVCFPPIEDIRFQCEACLPVPLSLKATQPPSFSRPHPPAAQ